MILLPTNEPDFPARSKKHWQIVMPTNETELSDNNNSEMYNIETVEGMGHVLVAARDIQPWELVIDDTCLVLAPNNYPVCLGCLGEVLVTTRL